MQATSHWPRERSLGKGNAVVASTAQFSRVLEIFVAAWSSVGQREKLLLLIHHWLDALACWSFEYMYLSATTLLQIIAATETTQTRHLAYFDAVTAASVRAGVPPLSRDFKDMRNNLIHEGGLLGESFRGADLADCAAVAADVLNWLDAYLHSVLGLGPVQRKRYATQDFVALNSYSV